jgi:hypothetical protein
VIVEQEVACHTGDLVLLPALLVAPNRASPISEGLRANLSEVQDRKRRASQESGRSFTDGASQIMLKKVTRGGRGLMASKADVAKDHEMAFMVPRYRRLGCIISQTLLKTPSFWHIWPPYQPIPLHPTPGKVLDVLAFIPH